MDHHGYEGNFVEEVPEYLKCIVCQMVLKQPVQILKCGHRFCRTCFDQLQNHAANASEPLCCPLDREIVDVKNTFEDTGMARIVANLQVKCPHSEHGCTWIGDLKDSGSHEKQCHCEDTKLKNPLVPQPMVDADALNELRCRLNKMEDDAMKKEKEILLLKDSYGEMRKQLDRKESDILSWHEKRITDLENELQLVRENFKKRNEKESDVLAHRNNFLEQRLSSLENRFPESRKIAEEEMEKVKELLLLYQKDDGKEKKNYFLTFVLPVFMIVIVFFCQYISTASYERQELKTWFANLNHAVTTMKTVDEQFSDKIDTMTANIQGNQRNVEDKILALRTKVDGLSGRADLITLQEKIDNAVNKLEDVVYQVLSIENIYLADTGGRPRDRVKVQWKVYNYKQQSDKAGVVNIESPVFRTQMKEYSFKILAHHTGDIKRTINIFFILLRSKDVDVKRDLPAYPMRPKLQVIGVKGKVVASSTFIYDTFSDREHTIHGGEVKKSIAFIFLKPLDIEKYLVDDILTIRCILNYPTTSSKSPV